MRIIAKIFMAFTLCAVLSPAHSAVTCVLNKQTGKFERLAAKPFAKGGEQISEPCSPEADPAATLAEVQRAINDAGTKLVNPQVIVNTDKLEVSKGETVQPNIAIRSEVKETAEEMKIPGRPVVAESARRVEPENVPVPDLVKRDWVLKASHRTLQDAIEDFAGQVGYEVIYEARDFELNLRKDLSLTSAVGKQDFWTILTTLGESYRNSDGAFQVLPTRFKQIVILPMGRIGTNLREYAK